MIGAATKCLSAPMPQALLEVASWTNDDWLVFARPFAIAIRTGTERCLRRCRRLSHWILDAKSLLSGRGEQWCKRYLSEKGKPPRQDDNGMPQNAE